MGHSASASLCYGIEVPEDFDLPFDDGDGYQDVDVWWRLLNNCPHQWPKGIDATEWYAKLSQWRIENPVPFDLQRCGYHDNPGYVLCVPGTLITSEWETQQIDTIQLVVPVEESARFGAAIERYIPELAHVPPSWILFPYYG